MVERGGETLLVCCHGRRVKPVVTRSDMRLVICEPMPQCNQLKPVKDARVAATGRTNYRIEGVLTRVNNSMRSKGAQLTSGALWRSCSAGNESLRKNCIFHCWNGEHVLIDAMLCQPEVIQ